MNLPTSVHPAFWTIFKSCIIDVGLEVAVPLIACIIEALTGIPIPFTLIRFVLLLLGAAHFGNELKRDFEE